MLARLERASEYALQSQILGALMDLLEYYNTRVMLLGYRLQQNGRKGVENLLIALWEQEEAVLGVAHGEDGFMAVCSQPLQPTLVGGLACDGGWDDSLSVCHGTHPIPLPGPWPPTANAM